MLSEMDIAELAASMETQQVKSGGRCHVESGFGKKANFITAWVKA